MKKSLVKMMGLVAAVLCLSALMVGCSSSEQTEAAPEPEAATKMVIGTMMTEDALPLWVAQDNGYFAEEGLDVEIMTFQSAHELSTAFSAGEIDAAMTDIQVSAALYAGGVDVFMPFVTMGVTADQGRFGIITSPESGIESLEDLAGVPIGVGSNTVPEYVMDQLMLAAGIPAEDIAKEEMPKVPVRFEAMMNNQVAAAALPGTLLALGEATGCVVLADDTTGDNISQSVFSVRADYINGLEEGTPDPIAAVMNAWNSGAADINADPESFRPLLIEMAKVPEGIQDTYPVATYPEASLPTADMVEPVLAWMLDKEYLAEELGYDETTGHFVTL